MKTLQNYLNESLFNASSVPANIKKELKGRDIKEWVRIFNDLGECLDRNDVKYYDDEKFWPGWEGILKLANKEKIEDEQLIAYFDDALDVTASELWETFSDAEGIIKDFNAWLEFQ